jgi:hypothetical protein
MSTTGAEALEKEKAPPPRKPSYSNVDIILFKDLNLYWQGMLYVCVIEYTLPLCS